MQRKSDHLGEVAGGRFAAVVLPVGVGGETDGGIERQLPGEGRELPRIEGQQLLGEQQGKECQKADQVEEEHGEGVAPPIHLVGAFYPAQPVKKSFARSQQGRKKSPFSLIDPGHEGSKGFCEDDQRHKKENCLLPIVDVHRHPSEILFISTSPQYTSRKFLPCVPASFLFCQCNVFGVKMGSKQPAKISKLYQGGCPRMPFSPISLLNSKKLSSEY